MSGKLIIFEGGEGAGKSTLASAYADYLTERGHAVIRTREPGGSPHAEEIRHFILSRKPEDNFDPDAQLCLFYAARMDHVARVIRPALERGEVVICDRFEISTYVYQIHAQQGNLSLFLALHEKLVEKLQPDKFDCRYIHCDVDPEIGLQRVAARRGSRLAVNVFDDAALEFHYLVREGMHRAKDHIHPAYRHHVVDVSRTPEEALVDVQQLLKL